jgi:hypothetical protein
LLGDELGAATVERTIEGDDAAEGRGRVGLEGLGVGLGAIGPSATPQGLACLTITQAGVSKDFTHFPRRVGIGDVVVRELLALQLLRGDQRAGAG